MGNILKLLFGGKVLWIVIGVVMLSTFLYIKSLRGKIKDNLETITVLQLDTATKATKIIILEREKLNYVEKLKESARLIDQIKEGDASMNPGLVQKLPTIEEIKRKKL